MASLSPSAPSPQPLVLPAVVHSGLLSLAFLGDRMLLGDDEAALAALHLPSTMAWSLTSVVAGVGVATLAMAGRAHGAGDREAGDAVRRAGVTMGVRLGWGALGLGALLVVVLALGLGMLSAEQLRYLVLAAPAVPLAAVEGAAVGVLVGRGDTRRPMAAACVGTALHLAVTALGGALGRPLEGTALGVTVGLLCQAALVLRWTRPGAVAPSALRRARGRLVHLTGPALTERVCYHVGFVTYAAMLTALPASELAANQALLGLEALIYPLAEGCGVATSSIVARGLGARAHVLARVGRLGRACVAMAGLLGLLFVLAPRSLLATISSVDGVLDAGVASAPWVALAQPLMAAALVGVAALRGAGETRAALVVTAVGTGVRVVGTGFALALGTGLSGAWAATVADWAVQAVLAIAVLRATLEPRPVQRSDAQVA